MKLPVLSGAKIRLRPLRRSDIPAIAEGANNPNVAKFVPLLPRPYTIENARYWVNLTRRTARNDSEYNFGIEQISEKGIIGMIGLHNFNRTDKNAETGYWLAQPYWGRGYLPEALDLLLGFAFETLGLHRVYAVTDSNNQRSIRVLEKIGFTHEGTWRKACWMDGAWSDVYAWGILEEEWAERR